MCQKGQLFVMWIEPNILIKFIAAKRDIMRSRNFAYYFDSVVNMIQDEVGRGGW